MEVINKNVMKYDVAIAYRIYPEVSKKPFVYQNNKIELAKLCLKSLRRSLGKLNVKVFALLDDCPAEYEKLFRSIFNEEELIILKYNGIGNRATFEKQIEILLDQNFSENIYFAEDDYYYLPNQFGGMIELLNQYPKGIFISPYDHPDYYTLDFHRNKHRIQILNNKHWRTANSTCLTFLTKKNVLKMTKDVFNSYSIGNLDSSLWISLTKTNLFNPKLLFDFLIKEPFYLKSVMKSWVHCWKQILFGQKWELWIPIPTIATHMDEIYLAPGIDWKSEIQSKVKMIESKHFEARATQSADENLV